MNKFVCFDIGNVLFHVNLDAFIDGLIICKAALNYEEGYTLLNNLQPLQDIGVINLEDFLSRQLKLSNQQRIYLHDIWLNRAIKPNEEMLQLLKELNNEGLKIAILSNIGFEHAGYIRECFNLPGIQHFSYEVGARKPSKLFFQSFLFDYPEFKDAPFFDDRQENLIAAKKYFRPFLFDLSKGDDPEYIREIVFEKSKHPSFF